MNEKIIKYAGRHLLPEECRNTLFNSFVFSRLNYGIEVYVSTEKKFLTPLKTSRNKLLRILQFKYRKSSVNDLYKSFGVLKLTDMHKYNLIILMHKLMHHPNKIPGAIKELFTQHSQIHSYNTRINMTYMQHISIPKPMDAGNSPSYAEKTGILFQLPQKNRNLLANSKNP